MARREDETLIVQQRLGVLRLGALLKNVSEACRRMGIHRSQYYTFKRRLEQFGMPGLKDRPPVHKSHPLTTPQDVSDAILEISMAHPRWGCRRIGRRLLEVGHRVSCPTIQKILIRAGRGKRVDRLGGIPPAESPLGGFRGPVRKG